MRISQLALRDRVRVRAIKSQRVQTVRQSDSQTVRQSGTQRIIVMDADRAKVRARGEKSGSTSSSGSVSKRYRSGYG